MNQEKNPESIIKGRIAEALFEELLLGSRNTVYRFGYEAILQNLIQLDRRFDRYSKVGEQIGSIPDFVVIDGTGKPMLVEVKFRWDGKLNKTDIIKERKKFELLNQFWAAKLVMVNCRERPFFTVVDPPYIKNGELLTRSILEEKSWNLDKKLYDKCEDIIYRYMRHIMARGEKLEEYKRFLNTL